MVALFTERARARDPSFGLGDGNLDAVSEICGRVDGLPLAIELAAARCGLLSPIEIVERLDAALAAPGAAARDAPARQHTLRATIDWSYDLLSDDEKACFARFAVFAGGATVAAAETITGASLDTLDHLVAKSLLVRRQHAQLGPRLAMLETIRAYAVERFAATGDAEAVRERHFRHYLAVARRHGAKEALWRTSSKEHLARLDAEIDNLHAALRWAIGDGSAEAALEMCVALGWYWLIRDRYAEVVDWIGHALSLPGADAHPGPRVRALCIKSWALWPVGRGAEQASAMAEAEAIARTLADPVILSQALETRAGQEAGHGRPDITEPLADEALHWATVAGDEWAIALAAFAKAMDADSAVELRERVGRAAALLDHVGDVYHLADLLTSAAYVALCQGSDVDASALISRATPIVRQLENQFLWTMLRGNFALAALLTGDADTARQAFREELALSREMVVLSFASEGLYGLAAVAAVRGELGRAARLCGAAAAHRQGDVGARVEARLHTNFFAPARARHGTDAWDAAVKEGSALSFQDALAYALEEPQAEAG